MAVFVQLQRQYWRFYWTENRTEKLFSNTIKG